MKTIQLGKNYRATTRYFLGEKGCIEQQTKIYERYTGSQVQTVFATKHSEVKITRSGLIIRFKFNRFKMDERAMDRCIQNEKPIIIAFLKSPIGKQSVDTAEREILKAESNRSV